MDIDKIDDLEKIIKDSRKASLEILSDDESCDIESEYISNVLHELKIKENLDLELNTFNKYNTDKAFKEFKINSLNKKTISKYRRNKSILYWSMGFTAAILLVFVLILDNSNHNEKIILPEKSYNSKDFNINLNKNKFTAILKKEDGASIKLDSSILEIDINNEKIKIDNSSQPSIAYNKLTEQNSSEINKLIIPKGSQYTVYLNDGTKVILNSDSYLEYPTIFKGSKRVVKLVGEAFFDVAHDKERKFIVETPNGSVCVYGTMFNVRDYKGELNNGVTLAQGSIKVITDKKELMITPGEKAFINTKGILEKERIDIDRELSWLNNMFDYVDTPLNEIVGDLSRWYNVDIKISSLELASICVTMYISKDRTVEGVFETITKTGAMNIKKLGDSYFISKNI